MFIVENILAILASSGGVSAVIVGLSVWLGKVLATSIANTEKSKTDAELKRLSSGLETERKKIEITQTQLAQISTEIDLDLRERRIQVYKKLWKATELLPKWPRADNVTYEELKTLSTLLRDWYFTSGMFTSRTTHNKAYAPLQKALKVVIKRNESSGLVSNKDYNRIRKKCSRLRSSLTNDILSRKTIAENQRKET